jgi:hypothetical protein
MNFGFVSEPPRKCHIYFFDFDVDFLFDEIPNDEDLPTCGEQSNDDTIGQTEVEDEIETTTYLRKPGKSTYYSTSSYRPINLTCIMCKLMAQELEFFLVQNITLGYTTNTLNQICFPSTKIRIFF